MQFGFEDLPDDRSGVASDSVDDTFGADPRQPGEVTSRDTGDVQLQTVVFRKHRGENSNVKICHEDTTRFPHLTLSLKPMLMRFR